MGIFVLYFLNRTISKSRSLNFYKIHKTKKTKNKKYPTHKNKLSIIVGHKLNLLYVNKAKEKKKHTKNNNQNIHKARINNCNSNKNKNKTKNTQHTKTSFP